MQTFDISLSPESSSELPWMPVVNRLASGVEMFQPGDHLVRFGENIFHHGIVVSCDRSNVDVVHFDDKGVHREIFGRFWHPNWDEPDWDRDLHQCHRINYAHYDQTAREKVVARAEAFAEPPGLGSHPLATEPEDYLAYCLTGTWNVPRKEVSVVVPLDLPPLPPGFRKDIGTFCTVM